MSDSSKYAVRRPLGRGGRLHPEQLIVAQLIEELVDLLHAAQNEALTELALVQTFPGREAERPT